MQEWYLALDPTMQVFWGCAIISSAVFAVQAILTLIGMDAHDAMDLDIADGDTMDVGGGLSLFSIRSLVNFFVGFDCFRITTHILSRRIRKFGNIQAIYDCNLTYDVQSFNSLRT